MDELALTIGYLVIYVAELALFIYALTAVITAIVHVVQFIGRITRRRPNG